MYVSNMDQAIAFYTEKLALKVKIRIADEWAEIEAGEGFTLGLHPARPPATSVGTRGSINIELKMSMHLDEVVSKLKAECVAFEGGIMNYQNVRLATLLDPDGNAILLAQILNSEI